MGSMMRGFEADIDPYIFMTIIWQLFCCRNWKSSFTSHGKLSTRKMVGYFFWVVILFQICSLLQYYCTPPFTLLSSLVVDICVDDTRDPFRSSIIRRYQLYSSPVLPLGYMFSIPLWPTAKRACYTETCIPLAFVWCCLLYTSPSPRD